MPITNPVSLPAIAFSRNMLNVVMQSDDYLAAAAVKSINFLQFATAIAADTVFELVWATGSATMTAKASPDDSGLQFITGDGSNGYVTSLLPYFAGNPFISRDFDLATSFGGAHPAIIFTSKNNGPDYDFTTTNSGASGVVTNGVTDKPVANFMHHLEVLIQNAEGTSFLQAFIANVALDFPLTGKTTVDIHDALHAFLSSDYPEMSAAFAVCVNSIRPYFFKMAQFFGDVPFVHKLFTSAMYVVNKGGLNKQGALLRDIVGELCPIEGHPELNRFLRQGSVNKQVTPEQPEWLTWINFANTSKNIALEVVIYNDDTSTFTFHPVASLTAAAFQKIQFPCGYKQLNIFTRQTGENPIYYTVQLIDLDAGTPLTQAYTFVIDYTFRPWPRYFVYENSYGAFQTLAAVGKGLNQYERTADKAQMAVNQSQAAINGEYLECNILLQEKGIVNIGYDRSDPRTTALLRDFLLSPTKYIFQVATSITPATLIPIGLNTTSLKDAADGVYVFANSFEYYPLYPEEVWSETGGEADYDIAGLLTGAGTPLPVSLIPVSSGDIVVEFGDVHLSMVDGQQTYTAPALLDLTGYRIWTTQQDLYFLTAEIQYNTSGFTILQVGFVLEEGQQLIIQPNVINPDL